MVRLSIACVVGALLMACGTRPGGTRQDAGATAGSVSLAFVPDAPLGGEAYVCFGFDVDAAVRATGIGAIDWAPPGGAVSLHHGKLYAVNAAYPAGPVPCDERPTGAVPLHTWAPGGGPLVLPDGVAMTLPVDTVALVVASVVTMRSR